MKKYDAIFLGINSDQITFFDMNNSDYHEQVAKVELKHVQKLRSVKSGTSLVLKVCEEGNVRDIIGLPESNFNPDSTGIRSLFKWKKSA